MRNPSDATSWTQTDPPGDREAIEREWLALRALWHGHGQLKGPGAGRVLPIDEERHEITRNRTILAGRQCNNRCRTCIADHGRFDTDADRLRLAVQTAAAQHGRVVLAGREPTLLPQLLALAQAARSAGATHVELVTNGRMLANPGVAMRLQRAGVTDLVLKRHRLTDAAEDAFVQAEGAGAQFWSALAAIQATPGLRWTLLLVPARGGEIEPAVIVEQAIAHGASAVHVHVHAAEVDVTRIGELRVALAQAMAVAKVRGVRCGIEGF